MHEILRDKENKVSKFERTSNGDELGHVTLTANNEIMKAIVLNFDTGIYEESNYKKIDLRKIKTRC